MRTSIFRLGFGLLLLAGAGSLTACNKTNVSPRGAHSGGCGTAAPADTTTTTTATKVG